jgi:hypothetical protein
MPRALRIAIWIAVFAACAGVGAFFASRTNPFPPGVQDPGAHSVTPSATTSPTPTVPPGVRWTGHMLADTSHHLFVGGTCSTAWRLELDFRVNAFGQVRGTGVARLQGHLRCDFPTAQVQSRTLHLRVAGTHAHKQIALRFAVRGRVPEGSDDYGGLIRTLPAFPPLTVRSGRLSGPVHLDVPDGDQGSYVGDYQVALSCQDC